MNHVSKISSALLASASLYACSEISNEVDIPLSEVPSNIITIVQNTLPGITLEEAEKEVRDEIVIYELDGKLLSGEEYEIRISETGTILKLELED